MGVFNRCYVIRFPSERAREIISSRQFSFEYVLTSCRMGGGKFNDHFRLDDVFFGQRSFCYIALIYRQFSIPLNGFWPLIEGLILIG